MDMEIRLIEKYNTTNPENGYNMRKGGYSNFPIKEVGRNISKSKMGHHVRYDVREKLSTYGRIEVIQLTMDGKYVATHKSITSAAKCVGAFKANIWAVCAGKKKTCKGYMWRYKKEPQQCQNTKNII